MKLDILHVYQENLPGKSISVAPIRPKSTIISTVQVCWVGFRLSKSKSGKSENSDL